MSFTIPPIIENVVFLVYSLYYLFLGIGHFLKLNSTIFNRRNLTLPSGQIDRSFSHVALISYTSDCDPAVGTGYHEGSQAVVPVPVYGFAILRFRLLGSAIHCFPPPLGLPPAPRPPAACSGLQHAPSIAPPGGRTNRLGRRQGEGDVRCVREP